MNGLRLRELCLVVPEDVTTGIIIGKTKKTSKVFHDIDELTAQFQMDTVSGFDIIAYEGGRALIVKLLHWGKPQYDNE
jgi:hypothetical protein